MPTIADVMKTQGYATGQFGKNHLGDRDEHLPTKHGFDEFFGNLYHLNAEEEPEGYFYPKDPDFKKRFGPARCHQVFRRRQDRGHRPPEHQTDGNGRRRVSRCGQGFHRPAGKSQQAVLLLVQFHSHACLYPSQAIVAWKDRKGIHADGMVEHDAMVENCYKQLDDLASRTTRSCFTPPTTARRLRSWPDAAR